MTVAALPEIDDDDVMSVYTEPKVPQSTAAPFHFRLGGDFAPDVARTHALEALAAEFPEPDWASENAGAAYIWKDALETLQLFARTETTIGLGPPLSELARQLQGSVHDCDDPRIAHDVVRFATELQSVVFEMSKPRPELSDAAALLSACERLMSLDMRADAMQPDTELQYVLLGFTRRGPIELIQFRYGSPWYLDATIWLRDNALLAGSLMALMLSVKKFCGLDLEVRLKRAQLKAQLAIAEDRLQDIERQLRERSEGSSLGVDVISPPVDFGPWVTQHAELTDDEDAPAHG